MVSSWRDIPRYTEMFLGRKGGGKELGDRQSRGKCSKQRTAAVKTRRLKAEPNHKHSLRPPQYNLPHLVSLSACQVMCAPDGTPCELAEEWKRLGHSVGWEMSPRNF